MLGALPGASNRPAQKAFVDWQNDVTSADLALATREGFRSIEHVKRYTTTGMATDQGKTSNLNALAIVAASLGEAHSRGWRDDVSHALHAGQLRQHGESRAR
jgi:sarcosine oxidase subunit alpha